MTTEERTLMIEEVKVLRDNLEIFNHIDNRRRIKKLLSLLKEDEIAKRGKHVKK